MNKHIIFKTFFVLVVLSLNASYSQSSQDTRNAEQNQSSGQVADYACMAKNITNDCSIYDPKNVGEKITLPDGTFIPNYAKILHAGESKKASDIAQSNNDQSKEYRDKKLTQRLEFKRILDTIDPTILGKSFRVDFEDCANEEPPVSLRILFLDKNPESDDLEFSQPWPPNTTSENYSVVKAKELRSWLATLPPETYERLKTWTQNRYLESLAARVSIDNQGILKEMRTVTAQRENRVKELVTFTISRIEGIIKNGVTNEADLSQEQKSALAKIRSIKFNGASTPGVNEKPECSQVIPNANYNPFDNSINICPNFYNLPDATILSIIGHEIGHSIDPCTSQFGAYSIDVQKLKPLTKLASDGSEEPVDEIKAHDGIFRAYGVLKSITLDGTKYTAAPFSFLGVSEQDLKYFIDKGVIKQISTPIAPSKYLFKDIYTCLTSEQGGAFHATTDEEILHIAKESVKYESIENEALTPELQKNKINQIYNSFKTYPECMSPGKHSQMGETMGDWFGTQVLAGYLDGRQLRTPAEKLSTIAFLSSISCYVKYAKSEPTTPVEVIESALQNYAASLDAHPSNRKRFDDILLRNSIIKKALGCTDGENTTECKQTATQTAGDK